MRNVNEEEGLLGIWDERGFYINYEECKLQQFEQYDHLKSSFILTMRNVNGTSGFSISGIDGCFILTMRNVNP